MFCLFNCGVCGGSKIGLLSLEVRASLWVSGQSDLHECLLSVREMLSLFSYVLVSPSAPSGTLTMLRLASPYVAVGY